jgi:glucokinase
MIGDLFQIFRDGLPRTRAELGALTGWSRTTVGLRLDELLASGFVIPLDSGASSGGRPSSQFALDPAAGLVLSVDLDFTHPRFGITDLLGTILVRTSIEPIVDDDPDDSLRQVVRCARQMLDEIDRSTSDLVAIGIGLPSPVPRTTRRPNNPAGMWSWKDFDIASWLQSNLADVPVLVENDANVMALGEHSVTFPDQPDVVFVKTAMTGVGAGLVCDGRLLNGSRGIAGDIGHIPIPRAEGLLCHCGSTSGCLSVVAQGNEIAKRLRGEGLDVTTLPELHAAALRDDPLLTQALRQAGRDIGGVLVACIAFVNPSVVVIGGDLVTDGQHLIAGVREVVFSRSMPLITEDLVIVQSRTGDDAGIIGAGMLALLEALAPERVGALVEARSRARADALSERLTTA